MAYPKAEFPFRQAIFLFQASFSITFAQNQSPC